MPLFDEVVSKTNKNFNPGDKSESLFSALTAIIIDQTNGGFAGFLQRFSDTGLGDLAASWMNNGANMPISNEQLESVMGEKTLKNISQNVGLDYHTTVAAAASMIPQIVDKLTPEGAIPVEGDVLAKIGRIIENTSPVETFDRIGTAAVGTIDDENRIIKPGFDETVERENPTALEWLLPLFILALLVVGGFMFCGKSEPAASANADQPATNSNVLVNSNQ